MLRWLVIVLCATSTMLAAANETSEPETPLMVPLEECETELTGLETTCTAELTKLEADCVAELQDLRSRLTSECDADQAAAIAAERRYYEPIVARERTAADEWKAEAEARGAETLFWKIISGVLALGLLLSLLF